MFSEADWSTVSLHRVFANRLQKVNRESWSCLLSLVSMLLLRCQLHQYQQLSSRARVRVNPRRHLRHPRSSNNRLDSWEWGPNVALPGSSAQTTSLILIRLNSFADLGRRPSVCVLVCVCVCARVCVLFFIYKACQLLSVGLLLWLLQLFGSNVKLKTHKSHQKYFNMLLKFLFFVLNGTLWLKHGLPF